MSALPFTPCVDIYTYYTTGFDSYKEFETESKRDESELVKWVNDWVDKQVNKKTTDSLKCARPRIANYIRLFKLTNKLRDLSKILNHYNNHVGPQRMGEVNTFAFHMYKLACEFDTGSYMLNEIIRNCMFMTDGVFEQWYMKDMRVSTNRKSVIIRVNILAQIARAVDRDNISL